MRKSSSTRAAMSTAVAFLVAPLVASFGVSFAGALAGGGVPELTVVDVSVWTLIFYVYALYATVILGLPSYFVLRRFGGVRWWSTALVGLFVGVAVFVVVNADGVPGLATQSRLALSWGGIGAMAALTFWVIWRQGHGENEKYDA